MKLNVIELAKSDDAKSAIIKAVGDISKMHITEDWVLVGTYIRPEKTKGGIYMPQKTMDEDRFQGKAGLVLAMGPTAFKYSGPFPYEGPKPEIHDWVMYRNSDSWECGLRGVSVRFISSEDIKAIIPDPDMVY
jgi:co-chaperonin GroES (HSP10)